MRNRGFQEREPWAQTPVASTATCGDRGGERGEAGGQGCRPCRAPSHTAKTFIVILTLPSLKKGFLPGEFHRWRSLVGYSPRTHKDSDVTQGLTLSLWASLGLSLERICLQCRRTQFDSWVGKISWRRAWRPTAVFLPGESPWMEEPGGCSPWGHRDLDTTE